MRFHVRIDGQPPGAAHGTDVDDQGSGTVTEPRLYQLIRQPGPVREHTFEIPHGPICSFEGPGGHRVAVYQLTRPEVAEHFEGRRDF